MFSSSSSASSPPLFSSRERHNVPRFTKTCSHGNASSVAVKRKRFVVTPRNVANVTQSDVANSSSSSSSSFEGGGKGGGKDRARVSIPWTLSRDPIKEGPVGPENLTWNPTNQTIKDWRSIYRNTSLSNQTQASSDARRIPKACVVDGEIPSGLQGGTLFRNCLLYTSPSPRDRTRARMPSSA